MPRYFEKGNQAAKGRGRPKKDYKLAEVCKVHSHKCVARLAAIVASDDERTSDQIAAINTLLGYGFGKPKLSVDATVDVVSLEMSFLEALKLCNSKVSDDEPKRVVDVTPTEPPKRQMKLGAKAVLEPADG